MTVTGGAAFAPIAIPVSVEWLMDVLLGWVYAKKKTRTRRVHGGRMDSFIGGVLRPIFVIAVWAGLVIPLYLLAKKYIPEGKIKRILFKRW